MIFTDAGNATVESICAVIYGLPKTGKTTLALSAHKPALLDFDKGVHRAGNRSGKQALVPTRWADVASMRAEDLAPFSTLIIDTVGGAVECLVEHVQNGRENLSPRDWGMVKHSFADFCMRARDSRINLIFIAHTSEEQRGETQVERIQCAGSSKNLVFSSADIIGRLGFDKEGKRILSFTPSDATYAAGLGMQDQIIDDPPRDGQMEEILQQAIRNINSASAEQRAAIESDRQFREWLDMASLAKINEAIRDTSRVSTKAQKRQILATARDRGWTFDKKKQRFEEAT